MTSSGVGDLDFYNYLRSFAIKKDDRTKKVNIIIIGKTNSVYSGKYHIPPDKYSSFIQRYYQHVFMNNKDEYLAESRIAKGPIIVDIDLKFSSSITSRQCTTKHIEDIILNTFFFHP